MASSPTAGASQDEGTETTPGGQSNQSTAVYYPELNKPHVQATRLYNDEVSSSGDEFTAKIRKPYTITKQRERWTDEEHQKFLEALKLHGRAWRRIEEHIGTKTAVQIRSHAQKFFTKLEREASAKGVPVGKTHDIHIPPPRPKRKPSHPYPRKAGTGLQNGGSGQPTNDEENKPLVAVSSIAEGLSVGIDLGKSARKNAAFVPYDGKTKAVQNNGKSPGHKIIEQSGTMICPSSLKLFGQMVVVPTDKRAMGGNVKGVSHEESMANKEEHLQCVKNVAKTSAGNNKVSKNPNLMLQTNGADCRHDAAIPSDHGNAEGSSALEGSGESNTNFISSEDNSRQDEQFSTQTDNNNSSHVSNKKQGSPSVPMYPRHVPVQQVEGVATENVHDSLRNGPNVGTVTHDFAAINMVTGTDSSSVSSGQRPIDFQPSALPNVLLPFSGAFNPTLNNPENFAGMPGYVGSRSALNCSFPPWHFNPSSALHHPAYAAATLAAAAFWPGIVSGVSPLSRDAQQKSEGGCGRSMPEETSALAALTAATVAAASAWWTLHGPIPPPFLHPGVYGPLVAGMAAEAAAVAAAAAASPEKTSPLCKEDPPIGTINQDQKVGTNVDHSMACDSANQKAVNEELDGVKEGPVPNSQFADFLPQNSPSVSGHNTSSCMEESCDAETNLDTKNFQTDLDDNELCSKPLEENKSSRNHVKERSSSGSNTPESETDRNLGNGITNTKGTEEKDFDFDGLGTGSSEAGDDILQKHGTQSCKFPDALVDLEERENFKTEDCECSKDDTKNMHKDREQGHSNTAGRRLKSGGHLFDSWRAVSEEGRIAFQALFDRDVLPQTFSPRQKIRNQGRVPEAETQSSCIEAGQAPSASLQNDPERSCRLYQDEQQEDAKNSTVSENQRNQGIVPMEDHPSVQDVLKASPSIQERKRQESEATHSNSSMECCGNCGTSSALNDRVAPESKQNKLSPISSIGNMRSGRGFVPYRRCSVEAKKRQITFKAHTELPRRDQRREKNVP
eukprot:TRINITY_DN2250_c0_g1_i1.p1 TRINITY_DN2250_c0_g1~~TRINITY_DN2250_c0_g1_i1.p1  ORF type:complete len:1014 (+),score=252.37 TRINITY_DN2250_c0_g1_i1:344-3385(+)